MGHPYRQPSHSLFSAERLPMNRDVRVFRRMPVLRAVLSLALILFTSLSTLHAQTGARSAALEGTILDPDGKAIVGAAVVIRNEATSDMITTSTDGSGKFTGATLAQGSYAIEVFVPGFEAV